jgi:hypothetical protein
MISQANTGHRKNMAAEINLGVSPQIVFLLLPRIAQIDTDKPV